MSEFPFEPEAGAPRAGNLPEYSVSELSQAVKRTVEDRYGRVRVRGEISGFKRANSGHLYLRLKDENAVLDAVCWRGVAGRLHLRPEDGMEVIATGRLTTYPGRSSYQIVIEALELAGEGALLKLLEERKRKLAAEGLFAEERKRPLPFLPRVIGVVTSPTGAVIRDILHRLADRFPRRVLVWPVAVQGDGAAKQIAAAIAGFNALIPDGSDNGAAPRPDVLIVARGGGSLEDLWAFNEEIAVRAAAASEIPLISAVGHETDTTLIDFASDRRAPTPTAAAELAVPVRAELRNDVMDLDRRLAAGPARMIDEHRVRLEGLARGLPEPQRLLSEMAQRLDERSERLTMAAHALLERRRGQVVELSARVPQPRQQLRLAEQAHTAVRDRFLALESRLTDDAERSLETLGRLLESTSYQRVLARGFAVVRGPRGLVTAPDQVELGMELDIEFAAEKHLKATSGSPAVAKPRRKPAPRTKKPGLGPRQGRLL